jgi:hypothetical protein
LYYSETKKNLGLAKLCADYQTMLCTHDESKAKNKINKKIKVIFIHTYWFREFDLFSALAIGLISLEDVRSFTK